MKNKIIIMGRSGAGKSYKALKLATNNKHTTVVLNGCCGADQYIEHFPNLASFHQKDAAYNFHVGKNEKYFIKDYLSSNSAIGFVNAIVFGCDYGTLQNDKKAMIVYDDGCWNRQENPMLVLWQLTHTRCKIVIIVESWEDLLHVPEREITDKMKEDVCKRWNVLHLEKAVGKAIQTDFSGVSTERTYD